MMSPYLKQQAGLLFKDLATGQISSYEVLIAALDLIRELAESEHKLMQALDEVCRNGFE